MTPSGIEPVTFRFLAQRLNHCATAVPRLSGVRALFSLEEGTATTNRGVQKPRSSVRRGISILYGSGQILLDFSLGLFLYHRSGAKNFEVVPRFLSGPG